MKFSTRQRYLKIIQFLKRGKEPKEIPPILYKKHGILIDVWTVYDAIKWLKRRKPEITNPDW